MLTGALIGLVVGVIGVLTLMARQSSARNKLKGELAAKSIQTQPGTGAMQMRQNLMMQGGAQTPAWSAMIAGEPNVNIYQSGGFIVAGWISGGGKPGSLAVTGVNGMNPDKTKLTEIPKKTLPVKGVKLFVDNGASPWVQSSPILTTFTQRFGKQPAWNFVYADGNAYLFSYQATWGGLDDIMGTAHRFESALRS